jgi:multicomponent Na+:H+ antiporter subunit G
MGQVVDAAAAVLVVLGMLVLTLAVYGMTWMPDTYTRLHAASKAALVGVLPLLLAAALVGGTALWGRAVLTAAFLALTVPVSAHAIARAAWARGERMKAGGVHHVLERDETGDRRR